MEEKIIELREDIKGDVRKLVMLGQHHEAILASIRAELANLLRLVHGVNLNAPGTILDAEGGVVVQRPPATVEAPPAPSEEGTGA